jgi:hypothetical protein
MELYTILFEDTNKSGDSSGDTSAWLETIMWKNYSIMNVLVLTENIVCLLMHSILSLNFFTLPLPAILSSHWTLVPRQSFQSLSLHQGYDGLLEAAILIKRMSTVSVEAHIIGCKMCFLMQCSIVMHWQSNSQTQLRSWNHLVQVWFEAKSMNQVMWACVRAIDGLLVIIKYPSVNESNGNPRSYHSSHYNANGLNVQAICDSWLCFLFFSPSLGGLFWSHCIWKSLN